MPCWLWRYCPYKCLFKKIYIVLKKILINLLWPNLNWWRRTDEGLHFKREGTTLLSFRFAVTRTMCLSRLSRSWGTGSEKNLIAQLVSRPSLTENQYWATRFSTIAMWEIWFRENHGDFTGSSLIINRRMKRCGDAAISIFHHAKPQIVHNIVEYQIIKWTNYTGQETHLYMYQSSWEII